MKPVVLLLALVGMVTITPVARAGCQVEIAALSFGVIDTLRTNQATGKVSIRCDEAQTVRVALSGGAGGGERRLAGPGTDIIPYFVFAQPGGLLPWGDGMVIGPPVAARLDGAHALDLPSYGVIPPVPGTQPGTYVDTLLVTIIF